MLQLAPTGCLCVDHRPGYDPAVQPVRVAARPPAALRPGLRPAAAALRGHLPQEARGPPDETGHLGPAASGRSASAAATRPPVRDPEPDPAPRSQPRGPPP